jgi:hypothetical protein
MGARRFECRPNRMTAAEFKRKWARYRGKESSAYQEHFNDLCRLLGHPTPVEADPSGNDFFCFQKGVIKDAGLLPLDEQTGEPKKGWADVWKKACFGWEYKGKRKNLDDAYKQLQQYREALENPPLLVVCDFDRYIIRTNFNGTGPATHEFTNDQIDRPENLRLLRACFENPEYLKPQRTTAQITERLAETIAAVAQSLQKREAEELTDAKTRAEMNLAQRKHLRIARFLNRIVFCFFAEDTGLLPKHLLSELLKMGMADPRHLAETLENLFAVMARGGTFGKDRIRHFNGHLFEESTVFELTEDELRKLAEAGEADWQFIQPSIMGTLFERALEPEQRSQLGAHYTSEADIKTLVEPVLMAPLRREWAVLKSDLVGADVRRLKSSSGKKSEPPHVGAYRAKLEAFQKKLAAVTVLDPACGSGNFLYVSLQLLLGLEKEVITYATQLGLKLAPQVSVQQLKAIEINPYAFELAQVSVQIGYLQWRRDNGFDNDRSPVLQNLDSFQNEDALLVPHFRSKARTLKQAQAGEHAGDDALKFYTERDWPKCDVIVGNPPFLGDKLMRGELGDGYVEELRRVYGNRIPGQSDLCCYWFEKARDLVEHGKCKRAGLLATQGIRGGANREVLKRIKETGEIFFAESDREWTLDGATVHVSMVGFDSGVETKRMLDSKLVQRINANLTSAADTVTAFVLRANESRSFLGSCKGGPFDITEGEALELLGEAGNPNGLPNSDLLRPVCNSEDLIKLPSRRWIVDTADMEQEAASGYELPFGLVVSRVKPKRDANRDKWLRENWWRPQRMRPEMRNAVKELHRFLITTTTSKHRLFIWLTHPMLPDHQLVVFASSEDYLFGVLHSRAHEVWSLAQGTQLREKESGFRYTPTTCFETFPFPFPDDLQPASAPSEESEGRILNGGMARMVEQRFLKVREEPPPYGRGSGRESAPASSPDGEQSRLTPAATPDEHRAAIAAAAKELNDLRERWLNPPEWTRTEFLEFPASVDGPWARYVECGDLSPLIPAGDLSPAAAGPVPPRKSADKSAHSKIGLARYPRIVPKDAACAAKLKDRTLTKLYNERPTWLDLAHRKLDAAVAAAYGWPADLTDEQILERLLALNLERAAAEAKAAQVKPSKSTRAKHADELL